MATPPLSRLLFVLSFLVSLPIFAQLFQLFEFSSFFEGLVSLLICVDHLSFELLLGFVDIAEAELTEQTEFAVVVLAAPPHIVVLL